MAQTPALMYSEGEVEDYTPSSAVAAGDVILRGAHPLIAPEAIAANVKGVLAGAGIWKIPQKAEVFTAGDAVYWDVDGTPVTGEASSGAATGTYSAGYLIGRCCETTANTDSYVKVLLGARIATATLAGSVTADDIVGGDSTLTITGKQGTTSAAGGTIVLTAGAGGATTGAGGAASLVGGAASGDNCAGGAVTINGGAGNGTGASGAIVIGSTAASITLGKAPRYPVTAVTATTAGVIGNSNACSEGINIVAGADDTAPVVLPASVAGAWTIIKSTVAAKNLIVYPPVGSTINNVGANNAYNMVADVGCSMFVCANATQWYSLPLVSS